MKNHNFGPYAKEYFFQYGFQADLYPLAVLESVLTHTKKSWIELYYRQFFTYIKILKNSKINTSG